MPTTLDIIIKNYTAFKTVAEIKAAQVTNKPQHTKESDSGFEAGMRGLSQCDNPFCEQDEREKHVDWFYGWEAGNEARFTPLEGHALNDDQT